jgi:hypothetical protein
MKSVFLRARNDTPDATDLGALNLGNLHVVSIAVMYFGVNIPKSRALASFLC